MLGVSGIRNQSGHIANASISFDTKYNGVDRPWYFDASPFDDDEFLMTQVLYGQLPPPKQTEGYHGTVPNPLEVGYFGTANDPAARRASKLFRAFLSRMVARS